MKENSKIYKDWSNFNNRMFPSDPTGSLDDFSSKLQETLVFIDEGFLDKLTNISMQLN